MFFTERIKVAGWKTDLAKAQYLLQKVTTPDVQPVTVELPCFISLPPNFFVSVSKGFLNFEKGIPTISATSLDIIIRIPIKEYMDQIKTIQDHFQQSEPDYQLFRNNTAVFAAVTQGRVNPLWLSDTGPPMLIADISSTAYQTHTVLIEAQLKGTRLLPPTPLAPTPNR